VSLFPPFTAFGIFRPASVNLAALPDGAAVYFDAGGPALVVLEEASASRQGAVSLSQDFDFLFLMPSIFRPPAVQELTLESGAPERQGQKAAGAWRAAGPDGADRSSSPPEPKKRLRFEETATDYRRRIDAVKKHGEPEGFFDRILLARAYRHFGVFDLAEELLGRMVFEGAWDAKKKARAFAEFAITLRKQGRFEEALQKIDRALRLKETNPYYHCERGMILRAWGRYGDALQELERARGLDPTRPRFYIEIAATLGEIARRQVEGGQAREARRTYESALRYVNHAIRLGPDHPRHYCERAIVHRATKRFDGALSDHQKAVQLDDSYPRHFLELGITLKEMNDTKAAQKATRKGKDLENLWQRLSHHRKK